MDNEKQSNADMLSVLLNYRPLGFVRATARGIEEDGISVDTGNVTLPRHGDVEVTLSYGGEENRQVHRINASIAESGLQGTRLRFGPDAVETLRFLETLRAAKPAH